MLYYISKPKTHKLDELLVSGIKESDPEAIFVESLEKSDTKVEIKKDDNLVKEIKRIKRKIRNVKKKLLVQPEDPFLQNELEEMKTRVELLKNRKGVK